MFTEMPRSELQEYRPDLFVPKDLDAFWRTTLSEVTEHSLDVMAEPVRDTPLRSVVVYEVAFAGFGGQQINAWYLVPRHIDRPQPTIVEYIGYGGGRGLSHESLFWSAVGYLHLIMDTRGQGSAWRSGDTTDGGSAGRPHVPGFLTDGLPDRGPIFAVLRRSPPKGPYTELVQWCQVHHSKVDKAFETLAYFDLAILVRGARCPALFGVALRDEKCPPSGGYACFNHYGGPKEMIAYEWNGHEGGEAFHLGRQADWLSAWQT